MYKVTVCICTKIPYTIIYDGVEKQMKAWEFTLPAKSTMDLLERLEGTHKDIISNINKIKCLQ